MTQPTVEVWLAVVTFTLAATTLALFLVRPMLRRRGMVDRPNHRSSHVVPTLRGGGIGVLIGLLAGWLGTILLVNDRAPSSELGLLATALVVVLLFGVVGWCEDRRELSVWSRLVSQVVIALLAGIAFIWTTPIPGIAIGLLVPGLVFYVNVANFMDGINGISAQHGVVVAAYFGFLAYRDGAVLLPFTACVLGCAFLCFFPWNVGRALMFLGDTGSYVLGAASAVLAIWTMTRHLDVLVLVAPLIIYAVDVVFTLVRRVSRRAPILTAHREHVYQRLQQATASHKQAALLVTTLTCLCGAMGILAAAQPTLRPFWYAGAALFVGLYLVSPRWVRLLPTDPQSRRSSKALQAADLYSGAGLPPGIR